MNLSGHQYSKATRGLKQSEIIKDQQFKLIFTYPVLADQHIPHELQEIIRNFISASMLKEVFVSNALNMVSMASQIHPLTDERGNTVETYRTAGDASFGGDSGKGSTITQKTNENPLAGKEHDLKQKIREKTAVIKKLLTTDPRFKTLNPYVEIVTMDNMIDVPVIVGTKKYDIDSLTLGYVLLVALARKDLTLDDKGKVEQIFKIIEETKPSSAVNLLNNLTEKGTIRERIRDWFEEHPTWNRVVDKISQHAGNAYRWGYRNTIGAGQNPSRSPSTSNTPTAFGVVQRSLNRRKEVGKFNPEENFAFLDITKSNLRTTKLFFKFCLDSDLLNRQIGLDVDQGQISTTIQKTSGSIKRVFDKMFNEFIALVDRAGDPAIISLINVLYPKNSSPNVLELEQQFVNTNLLGNVQTLIYLDLKKAVDDSLQGTTSPEDAQQKVRDLKNLCNDVLSDIGVISTNIYNKLNNSAIRTSEFSIQNIEHMASAFEYAGSRSDKQVIRLEHSLEQLLQGNLNPILINIRSKINDSVAALVNELRSQTRSDINNVAIVANYIAAGEQIDEDELNRLTNDLINMVSNYIYFIFMYSLQIALCDYIDVVEVEIETSVNDVLDHPNYTIVVPLETILMISRAYTAKNYQSLLSSGGQSFMSSLNDNYIQGIMKYIKIRLGVPNLVIVDSKKNTIYYMLMHMSAARKANIKTLETFIKLTTDNELQGFSTGGYY